MRTTSLLRTRWAAIGAAIAITLGGGGFGLAHAALSSGSRSVFVPVAPCRLLDTRPAPNTVGARTSPLGPNETFTQQVTGSNGNCKNTSAIPTDVIAVALNVTVVAPTAASYLTVFPADLTNPPTASNLNWTPGKSPTPNKVDVKLSPSGAIKMFNEFGTVHVIADVVGYYQDHDHDDRYYTKTQADGLVEASIADVAEAIPGPGTRFNPSSVVDEHSLLSLNVDETVTSTIAGRWMITKSVTGSITCPSGIPMFFIVFDGTPLRSSITAVPGGQTIAAALSGITPDVVPAGAHTITAGADCPGTSQTGSSAILYGSSNVVVLN